MSLCSSSAQTSQHAPAFTLSFSVCINYTPKFGTSQTKNFCFFHWYFLEDPELKPTQCEIESGGQVHKVPESKSDVTTRPIYSNFTPGCF